MKLRKDLLFIGDKTLWFLITLLFAFSLITVFSSTSLSEEVRDGGSRLDLFIKQAFMAGAAFVLMVASLPILDAFQRRSETNVLMELSRGMLWIAFITGFMLRLDILTDPRLPDRALNFGVQYNVAEFFKFFLIFGLVGQIVRYRSGDTPRYHQLRQWVLSKTDSPIATEIFKEGQCFASRVVVLYAPLLFCIGCIIHGSFSSSAFLVIISYLIFCFGIEKKPRLQLLGAVAAVGILLMMFISFSSYSTLRKMGGRFETMKARVEYYTHARTFDINTLEKGSKTYEDMVEYVRQIEGAKVGIQRGGVVGVGVGLSKQKYKVAAYFNDFLFSFICEEYGLWGGILTVLVFLIIGMRGRYLSKYLDDPFDRILLNTFVLVVVLQAYMHIAVNLGIVPMTGQALPLLSSGNSALLTFTGIFAVTLYLSHKALVAKERKKQEKLFEQTPIENESDN